MNAKKSKSHIGVEVGILAAGAVAAGAGMLFLYGKNAARNRKVVRGWTMKIKGEVLDELERMGEVSEKTYRKLIDNVAEKYSKLRHVDRKDLEKIAKELKGHWKHISAQLGKKAYSANRKKARGGR